MLKLEIFEFKQGQKIKSAAKKAVALARKKKMPIMLKFDKFTQFVLTPYMEVHDVMLMHRDITHRNSFHNKSKSR